MGTRSCKTSSYWYQESRTCTSLILIHCALQSTCDCVDREFCLHPAQLPLMLELLGVILAQMLNATPAACKSQSWCNEMANQCRQWHVLRMERANSGRPKGTFLSALRPWLACLAHCRCCCHCHHCRRCCCGLETQHRLEAFDLTDCYTLASDKLRQASTVSHHRSSPVVAVAVAPPIAVAVAVVVFAVGGLPRLQVRQAPATLHLWPPLRQRVHGASKDAVQQLSRQAPQVQGAVTSCAAGATSGQCAAPVCYQQQRPCCLLECGRESGVGLRAPRQPLCSLPQPPATSRAGMRQPAVQSEERQS